MSMPTLSNPSAGAHSLLACRRKSLAQIVINLPASAPRLRIRRRALAILPVAPPGVGEFRRSREVARRHQGGIVPLAVQPRCLGVSCIACSGKLAATLLGAVDGGAGLRAQRSPCRGVAIRDEMSAWANHLSARPSASADRRSKHRCGSRAAGSLFILQPKSPFKPEGALPGRPKRRSCHAQRR